jgi:hypothetical protein
MRLMRRLVPLLEQVSVARPGEVGRPRKRPDSATADKAYSSRRTGRRCGPQDCRGDPSAAEPGIHTRRARSAGCTYADDVSSTSGQRLAGQ